MPKAEREGYAEPPFFFVEEAADSPHAVAWFPMKLGAAVRGLLEHWPDRLQVHLEILEGDFETVEFEAFGDVSKQRLREALDKNAEAAFGDGGVRFRVWREQTDRERCFGVDEHGVLFVWEDSDRIRKWLRELGAAERKSPLVYEGEHEHTIPEEADRKRSRFVRALGLEET